MFLSRKAFKFMTGLFVEERAFGHGHVAVLINRFAASFNRQHTKITTTCFLIIKALVIIIRHGNSLEPRRATRRGLFFPRRLT